MLSRSMIRLRGDGMSNECVTAALESKAL